MAIAVAVGLVASAIVVMAYARWTRVPVSWIDTVLISLIVGASILVWREAGNTPALNDDPIPVVSPNDPLSPVLMHVCLGLLAAFRGSVRTDEWPQLRAVLTLLSLVVNVVTIFEYLVPSWVGCLLAPRKVRLEASYGPPDGVFAWSRSVVVWPYPTRPSGKIAATTVVAILAAKSA